MDDELVERLRAQLRRDPTDPEVAFLLTLAVRSPLVVYRGERERLRRLTRNVPASTTRELIISEAAERLLSEPRPSAGLRRPESGPIEVVEGARRAPPAVVGDEEDLPQPKLLGPDDDER